MMVMMTPQRLPFCTLLLVAVVSNSATTTWAQTTDQPQQSSSSSTQCPLCVGGEEPNLTKTIGGAPDGPSCASLVSDVQLDTDGCLELQILGYRWCDCPTYPKENFCTMCENAFHDIPNRFKEIPGTDGDVTCDQLLFVKKTDLEQSKAGGTGTGEACDEAMKPGYICGCPNAEEPNCTICGGTTEDDAKMTNMDAVVTIVGMDGDGEGDYTCQDLANRAVLGTLTVEQCGAVQNTADISTTCGCINNDESSESTAGGGSGLGREETISNNNATTSEEDGGGASADSDTAASTTSSDVPIETDSTITEQGDGNSSGAGGSSSSSSSSLIAGLLLVGSFIMMA